MFATKDQRQKNIVNSVVLAFRGAKNIGIYGVVCSESLKIVRWLQDDKRSSGRHSGQQQQQHTTTLGASPVCKALPARRYKRARYFCHFWTWKRCYLHSFLPVTAPKTCKLYHAFVFEAVFCLDERKKKVGTYAVFKKSNTVKCTKPCKIKVF